MSATAWTLVYSRQTQKDAKKLASNIQHRLVYEVLPEERVVHVLRMWTHYE